MNIYGLTSIDRVCPKPDDIRSVVEAHRWVDKRTVCSHSVVRYSRRHEVIASTCDTYPRVEAFVS